MWSHALDLTAKENFGAALRVVRDMETLGASRAELTLLKGVLLCRLAEHENAVETLITAHERISRDWTIAPPNNKYLMCYASVWGQKALQSLGREIEAPFTIDFREISLKLVQRTYKRKFPLREHPDWSE